MHLPRYFHRHAKSDDAPYEVSGAAATLAGLMLAFFALAAGHTYLLRSGTLAAVISSSLVSLANGDRVGEGDTPLALNTQLTAIAQAKANDMATKSYFAHTSPEGHDPWYWFAREGYSYTYAGENLAVDFSDSAVVEAAWMNSPEHRANLLNPHFTEVGIATAEGTFNGHSTTFVAEEFGTPRAAVAFEQPAEPALPVESTRPAAVKAPVATTTAEPTVAGAAKEPVASTTAARVVPTTTPLVASTEGAPPVVTVTADASAPAEPSLWLRLLASPSTVLGWAYYLIAIATLLVFAYMTELELHKRHLRHAAEAGGLLAFMLLLFTLAHFLFFAHPVLAAL